MAITAESILLDAGDALFEIYERDQKTVFDPFLTTNPINRMFNAPKVVRGDGLNMKFYTGQTDSVRASKSPNADIVPGESIDFVNIKLRFAENDGDLNDFTRLAGGVQLSWLEVNNLISGANREGAVEILVERLVRNLTNHFDNHLAELRLAATTAKIGQLDGVLKQNDSRWYADASSWSNASTGRLKIDVNEGSIVTFWPGRKLLLETSTATGAVEIIVTDQNVADNSFGFRTVSGASITSSAYDNGSLYLTDEKGAGMNGPQAFYVEPTSGDSYIGGIDRTSSTYRFMIPTTYRAVASGTTSISRTHLEELAGIMRYAYEQDDQPWAAYMGMKLYDKLRQDIGGEHLVYSQNSEAEMPIFGNRGVGYVHPKLGTIELMGDVKKANDSVWLHNRATWSTYAYGTAGLNFMPGNIGRFINLPSTTPGQMSQIYALRALIVGMADVCHSPYANGQITNLSA